MSDILKKSIKNQFKYLYLLSGLMIWIFFSNQTTATTITPAEEQEINTIIFDLGGVVFATDSMLKYKLIWSTVWQNPSLLYYLIVFSAEQEYFKLLHSIPAVSDCVLYHQCKPMPQIMADWQVDADHTMEINRKINQAIQDSAYPDAIKNFFKAIAEFMFNPESLANAQKPITKMIELIQQLKQSHYKLYALSNWDKESFNIIHAAYPEIFDLFDHFLISGHEKMAKPSAAFFQKLIDTHQIDPHRSIFIDDEPYNIHAAERLGINTILCTSTQSVIQNLKKFGIVV